MIEPSPAERLVAVEVSTLVSIVRNVGPEVLRDVGHRGDAAAADITAHEAS